jgi:FkbM family methyltransferase
MGLGLRLRGEVLAARGRGPASTLLSGITPNRRRMLNRIKKGLSALAVPAYWPTLSRGVVPSVEHAPAFRHREFASVLDVGANKGQFAEFARHRWPAARLICFEPLPDPRAKLENVVRGRAEVHQIALGNADGEMTMHVASRDDSSSLLPMGDAQKKLFSMGEEALVSVPVRRLDTVVHPNELVRPALLKIDVQGFEFETLQGALGLLPSIDAVYVECSFVELYVGQKLAVDVTELLRDFDFVEKGRFNVYRTGLQEVQADLLFEPARQ